MKRWSQDIPLLFNQLMKYNSLTNTKREIEIESFLEAFFRELPYFKAHPEHTGLYDYNDSLGRKIGWSLIKGKSNKTILLLHHHDIVPVDDYGSLKPLALHPTELKEALKSMDLDADAKQDLTTDDWVFGRGAADMRAAMAIHMALVKYYSEKTDFEGNLLFLSVPDEESLSEGMRGAPELLLELQEKHGLNYLLAIDSEPHLREQPNKMTVHTGSVGKLLPMVYVKGKQTHVSNLFEGLNPLMLLGEIIKRTEGNMILSEEVMKEMTPPPSWGIERDLKKGYDVSTPDAAYGMLNMLCLRKGPADILDQLVKISTSAFEEVIDQLDLNYWKYCKRQSQDYQKLPWEPEVLTYEALHAQLLHTLDSQGREALNTKQNVLKADIQAGAIDFQGATLEMIAFALSLRSVQQPVVVIALMPPYYPPVTLKHSGLSGRLMALLKTRGNERWHLKVKQSHHFMGISDLSYLSLDEKVELDCSLKPNMPVWNLGYTIPLEAMRTLQIPGINLGPWGKDIHKMTERVYWKDVIHVVPDMISELIENLVGENSKHTSDTGCLSEVNSV